MYEIKNKHIVTYDGQDIYIYRDEKNYALKQLEKYTAVYPLPPEQEAEDDTNEFYCDFFKEGRYVYSLRRNNYYPSEECLVEFYKNKEGKVVFIFNKHHGTIDVCDADTGATLHTDKPSDKFIRSYKRLGNSYLFFEGWYWSPVYYTAIYEMDKLVNEEDYEAVTIDWGNYSTAQFVPIESGIPGSSEERTGNEREARMLKSEYLDREFAPETLLENHKEIAEECRLFLEKLFNKHRGQDIYLRELLRLPVVGNDSIMFKEGSRERLEKFINNDVVKLNVTVTGKVSGSDLPKFNRNLIRKLAFVDKRVTIGEYMETITKKDHLKYLTVKMLLPFTMFGEFENGFVRRIPVDAFHLRFRFDYATQDATDGETLTVEIDQELAKEDNGDCYCVSDDLPCKVVVS